MPLRAEIATSFLKQADDCARLGSPFTSRLCRLMAESLEPDSAFGERIDRWAGAADDALPLRAAGGLHALARSQRCPELSAAYPPNATSDAALWKTIGGAIRPFDAFLTAYLDSPPQTNEVARSSAILGGCLHIAAITKLPLAIYEIGSSAGLNLQFDSFRYALSTCNWGGTDSRVDIESRWDGSLPPLDAALAVDYRSGCDVAPLDPSSEADRERLLSYIWADQAHRIARAEAALALAARKKLHVDKADAADWLEAKLGNTGAPGRTTVVLHSSMWQYLTPQTKDRIKSTIRAAGSRATADAPLAWLSIEPDGAASALIRLTVWPRGSILILGRADFHGRWVQWGTESKS
jgi:hypothetical protein